MARRPRQPRDPRLRLRAPGGADPAPRQHAAPALRVRRGADDARPDLAGDARAQPRGRRDRDLGGGGAARGDGRETAGPRRRGRAGPPCHDGRDVRRGGHLLLPRRAVGRHRLRPRGSRAPGGPAPGDARRGTRAALLRAGRQPDRGGPPPGPGRRGGARRATGPRVRASQAVSRRALERGAAGARCSGRGRGRRGRGRRGRRGGELPRRRDRRMTPRPPLPGRILIPVANPATAEELIRIGAALLDPRDGELTALGIVEVPEEMPLSEGATKARQARRLLQKVLDYAPEGTHVRPVVRSGRRAAEGIVEAAIELEADLVIFGWGGRTGGRSGSRSTGGGRAAAGKAGAGNGDAATPASTVFSSTAVAVVRESPCG